MALFDTVECDHCDSEFAALADSNAAVGGYCSPRCERLGRGL